ncbi:MAG: peptide chain release factor N(5)-glutamine methyltransferase [Candidatus Gastranaerophilales bacterium]|nr:peptide chain release factor N(5)-glutamine methyltransferase [Candidatus Gastranaerophilales bacterium]
MFRKKLINLYLEAGFDAYEAQSEVDFLLEVVAGFYPQDSVMGRQVDKKYFTHIESLVSERLETRKPIQQLAGKAFFMGDLFFVDKNTLIPRPETEILVRKSIDILEDLSEPEVLDIGSGTGCIAIEIAKNTAAKVISCDISSGALKVAVKNAEKHKVQVDFIESDLFQNIQGKFDLIVSNPPYIPFSELENLQIEVRKFEPQSALFAENNGLGVYERIIKEASKYLKDGGNIAFELGIGQAASVELLLEDYGFSNISLKNDLDKIARVIIAKKSV